MPWDLLELAAQGALKPRLHAVYPWEAASEAHAALAKGDVRGKILLKM